MEHCEKCIWFGGYIGKTKEQKEVFMCVDPDWNSTHTNPYEPCGAYKERKDMTLKEMKLKEAYKVLQAEWVKLYNVEVGDTVRVLSAPKENDELGTVGCCESEGKKRMIGNSYEILRINSGTVAGISIYGWVFPFFCLELVKKAEPKIEINVKINGKTAKLSQISEETLSNLRDAE